MTVFSPGKPVVSTESKTGSPILVRYPQWEDLYNLQDFINTISAEDTYITFSGEHISLESEADYLLNWYKCMELRCGVCLVCESGENIIAQCGIEIDESDRERGKHVGVLGLSVAKEFRGQGVGETLIRASIEEARQHIENLRIIRLRVFAENTPAIQLYKKVGFIEAGRIPGVVQYKGEYLDRLEMYLPLA